MKQKQRCFAFCFVWPIVWLVLTISITTYAEDSMVKPKVIIFDVNETLLDLAPLRRVVGETIDGREDLLPLWFSTMLHYSLVDTLTNNYQDFGQIGAAALVMVAEKHGITVELGPVHTNFDRMCAYGNHESTIQNY
ncbi:hypothetical protein [Exilibacterium tricleocarpae]|uniref:hypothetical protein n=1 Tax=Exilibacterium tricleocarpae TaxID=2591008 RepID=UPI001C555DB4|nr:hypothetical protein [Exilibacterium tricleocarpae]